MTGCVSIGHRRSCGTLLCIFLEAPASIDARAPPDTIVEGVGARRRCISDIASEHELRDIADHIVKAPCVGFFLPDGVGLFAGIPFVPGDVVEHSIAGLERACAGCVFPLRLGGQAPALAAGVVAAFVACILGLHRTTCQDQLAVVVVIEAAFVAIVALGQAVAFGFFVGIEEGHVKTNIFDRAMPNTGTILTK